MRELGLSHINFDTITLPVHKHHDYEFIAAKPVTLDSNGDRNRNPCANSCLSPAQLQQNSYVHTQKHLVKVEKKTSIHYNITIFTALYPYSF